MYTLSLKGQGANKLLLCAGWEQIGISFRASITTGSRIKRFWILIRLITNMMGAVKCLALISDSCQPAAVLTVLDWRVKPPRRPPRLTRDGIGRVFIGASVRKRKRIFVTLSPGLNHELSPMIRTLLTVLPTIGRLSRNIAALPPDVVSGDPASEFAVSVSRSALHRATVGTGIADRVSAEHIWRTVIVAEDAPVLIFGLGYNLDGGAVIWIARSGRHFARGLCIFLYSPV